MPIIDPLIAADRLLHGIDPGLVTLDQRLELVRVLVALGHAEQARDRNLLQALILLEENDRTILRAVIRRRLRVLPPTGDEPAQPNGGA